MAYNLTDLGVQIDSFRIKKLENRKMDQM